MKPIPTWEPGNPFPAGCVPLHNFHPEPAQVPLHNVPPAPRQTPLHNFRDERGRPLGGGVAHGPLFHPPPPPPPRAPEPDAQHHRGRSRPRRPSCRGVPARGPAARAPHRLHRRCAPRPRACVDGGRGCRCEAGASRREGRASRALAAGSRGRAGQDPAPPREAAGPGGTTYGQLAGGISQPHLAHLIPQLQPARVVPGSTATPGNPP